MHPPLAQHKHELCGDLIQALQECHSSFITKYTGGCNDIKYRLNMCLRRERVERTSRNRKEAKEKQERIKEIWKEIEENS